MTDDEERNRYGVLLDRAAERGLLTPDEYDTRLGELSTATSVDEMRRIVSELPAFVTPARGGGARAGRRRDPGLLPGSGAGRRKESTLWLVLVAVVVVLAASLVFLALDAHRLSPVHRSTSAPEAPEALVSVAGPPTPPPVGLSGDGYRRG